MMNASRLRELTDLLIGREKEFKIQEILKELHSHLSNLAGSPQDQGIQTKFAASLENLRTASAALASSFQPTQVKLLEEIDADRFFHDNLAIQIATWLQENPISPAVTQQKVGSLVKSRGIFIDDITQLRDRLQKLDIQASDLEEGAAEIGILIPRAIFHNHLDELVKELTVLNTIFRSASEIATKSAQPVEVRQISTSDPLFFFGIAPATVAMMAGIVTWALAQWKKVEEIRKLRSETSKNTSFSRDEIQNFFDSKINSAIKSAIDEKVIDLLGTPPKDAGRGHEKRTELKWVLESILARVERGMTVEIRFVEPPAKLGEEEQKTAKPNPFTALREVAPQLVFPAPDASPVLEIPPPNPSDKQQQA